MAIDRGNQAGELTRAHLLDCAERLFAERGFHGASLRDITGLADVRLAAVNYHFGTKEGLLRAVVLRRAEPLNTVRAERLRAVAARGRAQLRIRGVADAFVTPAVEHRGRGAGWRAYFTLIAQAANSRNEALLAVAAHFNDTATRFIEAIAAIYPRASRAALVDAYQLMLGSTLYALSDNGRRATLVRLPRAARPSRDDDDALIDFVAAGMHAVCMRRRVALRPK